MKKLRPGKVFAITRYVAPYFRRAANRNSRPWRKHPLLILLVFAGGFAVSVAQTARPRTADIHDHLQEAEAYLKANDPGSAVKEFDAVLALDPRNAEARANLGVIAFFRGDCRSASENFRKALAIKPSLVKMRALLGICQKRLGDPSAGALLEKSFPKLQDKKLQLQVGLELAGLYDEQGNPGATASVMRSLVELDPDNVDVLFMAQRIYSELADDTLNKLAVLAPGSARMQQVIAEHLVNEGDMKSAIEHYRKALQLDPRLQGVRYELAEAVLQTVKGDPAVEADVEKELGTVIATEGDSAKVQSVLAQIAFDRSDLDQARAHYSRALALDPKYTTAQIGLARVLMTAGDLQQAREHLEIAVHSDPLNSGAHYQLAQACRRLQMTDEAKKEFQLYQEIKKTRSQVEELYRQMNRPMKAEPQNEATDQDAPHSDVPQHDQ